MWIATPSSQRTCTAYSLPVSRRTPIDIKQNIAAKPVPPRQRPSSKLVILLKNGAI
jgi:hypothetical protein